MYSVVLEDSREKRVHKDQLRHHLKSTKFPDLEAVLEDDLSIANPSTVNCDDGPENRNSHDESSSATRSYPSTRRVAPDRYVPNWNK